MAEQVINPRFRGFICTTAHPDGCAVNVRRQVELAKRSGPGRGLGNVLVLGSSTGFGLSSLITGVWGYGAKGLGVCFERPSTADKVGSPGWYNVAAVHAIARAEGRQVDTIVGDAFSDEVKAATIAKLKASYGPIDHVIYSLASPRRKDPKSDTVWQSCLKPIGPVYTSKTVDLDKETIGSVSIQPASDAEIAATVKVMGGEDWEAWISALADAGVLAKNCRSVAYSYIGPEVTYAVYRKGTIGAAKDHLEATAKRISSEILRPKLGGDAWVSVNKALVTQASSAIPVVPLYISLLYKVMKAKGNHEGTIEQILRLYAEHLAPHRLPRVDSDGRIRVDDWEMSDEVQAAVAKLWTEVTTENLKTIGDWDGFRTDFHQLFGFECPGIDYAKPVEVHRTLDA